VGEFCIVLEKILAASGVVGVGDSAEIYAVSYVKMLFCEVKNMSDTIEAVFDGAVFRPESNVALKPNTRVEITVTVKAIKEASKKFHVRSKHLGFRKDLNYDKMSELLEEIEGVGK
jgi:predicted DNA-binding antitoxin AbrB/MazE fold protein